MSRGRPLEIAIVGMGCRFPGARDLGAYWENILAGRDCIREVPPDRWDAGTFVDPASPANDRLPCGRGGYLDTPILFDAAEHGIMPRTVDGGEPEQFLVLDATAAALADAGLDLAALAGRRVEVVIGRGNYFNRGNLTRLQHGRMAAQTLALLSALHPEWSPADRAAVRQELKASLPPFEAATIPGQLTNAAAGRVLHRLDATGPGFVVDAASASSLVALDLAARALVQGRADLAIVGGVYLEADIDFPLVFRQLGALSPSGRVRPFAADADGTLSGEGVGVLILKRRRDAERRGDRIYAIVQGLGLASDGRGRGLAAPSARGHARAIRRAYRGAGIDPSTVMLVEGHGLGVPAADRAELRALNATFPTPRRGRRVLGAVSSMIGHAMPAAGMASLIKAALALFHRVLPPTLHAQPPHPLLDSARSPFAVNPATRPWIHPEPDTPRRAGVNSFGFAGINAHAVLEEHVASADSLAPGALWHWETEAILLSAVDRSGLVERARELIAWLQRHPRAELKDIAYTLNCKVAEPAGESRLGLVVASASELAQRLAAVLPRLRDPSCRAIRDGRGTYFWAEPLGGTGNGAGGLAFLFPGEGSQYPGMLADLCVHFPEVRHWFDTCDRIAIELGQTVPPSEHLFGRLTGDGSRGRLPHRLWSAPTAVNVVLHAQWALYQLLTRLGLTPGAVAGHSSGELLALAAAGVLQTDRELERHLGRLGTIFGGFEAAGDIPAARLVAVAAGRDRVETIAREQGAADLVVAIDNCPHQVVLAGPPQEVEAVVQRLRGDNIVCEDLPFARAYHTPSFGAVLGPVAEFFSQLAFRPPRLPIYSCAARRRMPEDPEAIRALAVAQWTRTVAFRETIEVMHADGLRVFLDVGARGNLAGFVEDTLRGRPAFAIAANLPRRGGLTQLNHLVAALFAQGVPLQAGFLYARRRPRSIDWDAPEPPARTLVELPLGFPEMRLPAALIDRLRSPGPGWESRLPTEADLPDRLKPGLPPVGQHTGPPEVAEALLAFQDTMQAFLQTQHEVLAAYLSGSGRDEPLPNGDGVGWQMSAEGGRPTRSGPEPGPWVGAVRRLVAGSEIESVYLLDSRDDPIAEHHTLGGRRVSAVDPSLKGLPALPFAVMAEMAAQVAALLVSPGRVLTGLEQVRAHKWVRYEEEPVQLELRGRRVGSTADHRIWVGIFNRGPDGRREAARPAFEAVAVFGAAGAAPPPAMPWALEEPRPSRFTAESLYGEQWLFHGPPFQALVRVGSFSAQGIEGTLCVRPWEPVLRPDQAPHLHTDIIIVDSFTHLLGCWGLDYLTEGGDVVFPLRMEELQMYGDRPPVGTEVECRIAIQEIQRHRVRVHAEILRPDGTVWMRLRDWEDWRFHWPRRYRDVFRQPRDIFVGEELPLEGASRAAKAVWLAPPADMGRPVWRDVLEQTQLGPAERAAHLAEGGGERRRAHRLWGIIAAKEAARRLWQAQGRPATYPADLAIVTEQPGRPRLIRVDQPEDDTLPAIAIAHAEGVAVAIAAGDPAGRIGIDVQAIPDRSDGLELARLGCARQAAARAAGAELAATEVVHAEETAGLVHVRVEPDGTGRPLRVVSGRRGDVAWAWTLGEGAEP